MRPIVALPPAALSKGSVPIPRRNSRSGGEQGWGAGGIVRPMPFRTGSVSYARFRVVNGPDAPGSDVLDQLAANAISPDSEGPPPEIKAGWVAGRHLMDQAFEPEVVMYGNALLFGFRIDTNRVPAEIRRAHRAMAESRLVDRAGGGPTWSAGSGAAARQAAREEAEDLCRQEVASGRHRRSKMIPVYWDVPRRMLLTPVFSDAHAEILRDLFAATFDADLETMSSGAIALHRLSAQGRTRDHEDAMPTAFTSPPPAAEAEGGHDPSTPTVPWAMGGPEPKDFLGNEMLLWLWARTELDAPMIETGQGEIGVVIDRALDMSCAWGVTGTQSLRGHGPARLPEAAAGLRIGKWPRKLGLMLAAGGEEWELTLQGDRFLVSGAKMPKPDEPPASDRELVEFRLASLDALDRALLALFDAFLAERMSSSWPSTRDRYRTWINRHRATPVELPRPDLVIAQ